MIHMVSQAFDTIFQRFIARPFAQLVTAMLRFMGHAKHEKKLVTRRDVALAVVNAIATLVATVVGSLLVMVVEHALY